MDECKGSNNVCDLNADCTDFVLIVLTLKVLTTAPVRKDTLGMVNHAKVRNSTFGSSKWHKIIKSVSPI